jgi:hypothetical protein
MGQLIGGIYMIGGPPPGRDVCVSGIVVVTNTSGKVITTARVGATEASTEGFAIAVPSGTYFVGAANYSTPLGPEPPVPSWFANEHRPIAVPEGGSIEVTIYINIA